LKHVFRIVEVAAETSNHGHERGAVQIQKLQKLSLPSTVGHTATPILVFQEHVVPLQRQVLASKTAETRDLFGKILKIELKSSDGSKSRA
jgi:hypothetical protein